MKIEDFNSDEFENSRNNINKNLISSRYDMKINTNTKNEKSFGNYNKFDDV
jgi:hypothetical protein